MKAWTLYLSELIGTALLVVVGLSLVILMFGAGTPMARVIPSEGARRLLTGFLFGTTGASIALSRVGRVSGAHINPAVTLAFRLIGKIDVPTTIGYVGAQMLGAVVGSLPLLLWGAMGESVAFGATFPGPGVPIAGMLLAVLACSLLAKRIEVAKLYHFDSDRDRLFRRMATPGERA